MHNLKRSFLISFLLLLVLGCNRKQIIHFYSLDRSQCITVITKGEYRYIINGEHYSVPDSNYVKLKIQNVSPEEYGGFRICWKNSIYSWDVVADKTEIVESTLDTLKYNFSTKLPVDKRGIPTEIKFRQPDCAVFSFYLMRLIPNQGTIVKIR